MFLDIHTSEFGKIPRTGLRGLFSRQMQSGCYRSSQICPFARISYASVVDASSSSKQRDQVILTQLTLLLEPLAKVSLSRQA